MGGACEGKRGLVGGHGRMARRRTPSRNSPPPSQGVHSTLHLDDCPPISRCFDAHRVAPFLPPPTGCSLPLSSLSSPFLPPTPPPPHPNPQVMRNTLYKAYLDDFSAFVHRVGGTTGEVMGELLSFEVRLCLLHLGSPFVWGLWRQRLVAPATR